MKVRQGFRKFALLWLAFILAACNSLPLTQHDKHYLHELRKGLPPENEEEPNMLISLVKDDPVKLAKESAEKGDYRLIALAMGYHATEKNASVVGLECAAPGETQDMVFGCIPPPNVVFKLITQYNIALTKQPGFPESAGCKINKSLYSGFKKMEEMEIEGEKRRNQRQKEKTEKAFSSQASDK